MGISIEVAVYRFTRPKSDVVQIDNVVVSTTIDLIVLLPMRLSCELNLD